MIFEKFKIPTGKDGASAVEFAIILPLLMLLVLGTIDFGLLLFNKQVLINATREGCRSGVVVRQPPRSVTSENLIICNVVTQWASNHLITFGGDVLDCSDVTIDRDSASPFEFGKDLTVHTRYIYKFLFLPGTIDLTSVSIMKMD